MEAFEFIFWEAIKILAVVFLGLLSVKAITGFAWERVWMKAVLYAVVLGLCGVGAWSAGNDVAAEVYMWRSRSDLAKGDAPKAYANAVRAVAQRPNRLIYWRMLVRSKVSLNQCQSALDDEPALRALSHDKLDEVDDYQFALCTYTLGRYDEVVQTTSRLIRGNPSYAAPYVLQGLAQTAQRKFPEAEASFQAVLQRFPTHQAAVEGLARAFYLAGERQKTFALLEETAKFPFPGPALQRFEALKGLYGQ